MRKIFKWLQRNALEVLMFLIAVIVFIAAISDYKFKKNEFNRIEKIIINEKLSEDYNHLILKLNDSTLVYNNQDVYQIQKDIIEIKKFNSYLKQLVEEKNDTFLSYLANFWTIIGLLLGTIAIVFSYKEKIKDEVSKRLSEFSNIEKDFIRKNLDEFQKHMNLKKDSKIVVLNEKGTKQPPSFRKVTNLYPNCSNLDVEGLDQALLSYNIKLLKESDLVVIENQLSDYKWNIKKQNIKEEYSKDKKVRIEEGNKITEDNIERLVELANKICADTTIVYYGKSNDGFFPTDKVKENLQENITFANAPAQLYSNMLNMLKFKLETAEK